MTAKIALEPIQFQYSVTPGESPNPTGVKVAGLAINIADRTLWSKDQNGEMFAFPLGQAYDAIIQAHVDTRNPHGMWDKEVFITTSDLDVDAEFAEWVIMRYGTGNATVSLKDECPEGTLVLIDNVLTTSNTVTVVSESGVIHFEAAGNPVNSHALTGKGQMRLFKLNETDWVISELVK